MKSHVALVGCREYDRELVYAAVTKAIGLLGGIESIIKPRTKVLLKPNLLIEIEPNECVTTHPLVVESMIRLLKSVNAEIYVGDSPSCIGEKKAFDRVYETTGMKAVCEHHGARLVYFDAALVKNSIPIAEWSLQCDYVINIPKFKTHTLTLLTGAIKNTFGCVMGMHKAKLHRDFFDADEFAKKIVDVFQIVKPSLTVVDAVVALSGDGPGTSGKKTPMGFILAGKDAVAVDSALTSIMGVAPHKVLTTKIAAERGVGQSRAEDIEVLGEKPEIFINKEFALPTISRLYSFPKIMRDCVKRLMGYKMRANKQECRSCGKCLKACPVGAIDYVDKKAFIDSSKCILCSCCQEVCPYKAIHIKKSLLLRLAGV